MSAFYPPPLTCARKFFARSLENRKNQGVNENHDQVLPVVKCANCRCIRKGGLTLFKFYKTKSKYRYVRDVVSCMHHAWDASTGCNCCHTIRDGKILCGKCAGFDVVTRQALIKMRGHQYMWTDGSTSTWVKKRKMGRAVLPRSKRMKLK